MGRAELSRNEGSTALTVELDATLFDIQKIKSNDCQRRQRSSPRIGCWSSARQTKFDGAWERVKVDQKDLDEHSNSWPSWSQSRTGEELMTNEGTRSGYRLLRRPKKQGAGTEASISRNGTTTLGKSRSERKWKLNTDECAISHSNARMTHQNSRRSFSIHSRINAYTLSSCRGVRV